jgi:hypothetical protein
MKTSTTDASSHPESPQSTESQPEVSEGIHPGQDFDPFTLLLPLLRGFAAEEESREEPPDTRQSAPVKEAQAETERGEPRESVVEGPNVTIARLGVNPAKTASDDMLSRAHWHAFTSPATISAETGVPISQMLCSIAKELTDNALDWVDRHGCPGAVTIALEGSHTIVVTNDGPGWKASPKDLAQVFSLARGSISSKLWRLPTRGAMGLGLIQVSGAVASGGGFITISSCNRRTVLRPRIEDGLTEILEVTEIDYPLGTSIRVELDQAYPGDPFAFSWAQTAIRLACRSSAVPYLGRPSTHWFDADAFYGLLHAVSPKTKLRDFLSRFESCSTRNITKIVAERFGTKCLCSGLSREEAALLLEVLQEGTRPVGAHRFKALGPEAWPSCEEGYAVVRDSFEHGARAPLAEIPFIVECWANVERGDEENDVELTQLAINRTPASSGTVFARRGRGRNVSVVINRLRIDLSLPKITARFTLNITSPFVPVLSGGKLADITPFADAIRQVIEQAVTRAQRSARRSAPTHSKNDNDKKPGKLHQILEAAAELESCSADELTVLSKAKDPYRLDTASGHRLGRWCADLIERFLAPEAKIHLRGLHYLLTVSADVTRPDGARYINSEAIWEWLADTAMKAARWLGYVRFERIIDERNAPPELYLPPYYTVGPERGPGARIIVPALAETMPCFTSPPWPVVQPYRIILIGEKTSLRHVLLPIAQEVGGELLLPTGEPSDTMIAELAARCALVHRIINN